jgi:hypothetical protein
LVDFASTDSSTPDAFARFEAELVNGTDSKTVNYNGLIGLLIEVVKEQQKEINNLKEKIK